MLIFKQVNIQYFVVFILDNSRNIPCPHIYTFYVCTWLWQLNTFRFAAMLISKRLLFPTWAKHCLFWNTASSNILSLSARFLPVFSASFDIGIAQPTIFVVYLSGLQFTAFRYYRSIVRFLYCCISFSLYYMFIFFGFFFSQQCIVFSIQHSILLFPFHIIIFLATGCQALWNANIKKLFTDKPYTTNLTIYKIYKCKSV